MQKKRTVLIVDDSQINRVLLRKILSNQYHLLEAENGLVALQILQEKREEISAVLLDVVMPVMDGFSFLQEYIKDQELCKVPVLITTQLDHEDVELKALSLGAVDFISKPFNNNIMIKRLENTIKMREITTFVHAIERDPLTNLYSKQAFYQRVSLKLQEDPQTEYDILSSDIERFKLINDIYGSKEGDQLLQYIANFLSELTAEDDVICGRISGDKFVLLLPRQSRYENRIIYHTKKALHRYHLKANIQIQFGLYRIQDVTIPISTMCDRANLAISSIKGVYGNQLAVYEDSIIDSLRKEQTIVDEMGDALERGEFQVYYQAKYDLTEETICGAEALARWIHKDKGLLPPDGFIPVFEKNGFITTMDAYIWEETCRFIRKRMDEGKTIFPISVNVSRVDILNPKVVDILTGLLQKYNLQAEYLHLEITETAYAENEEQVSKVVARLKALGFFIEMDDFGSRYSSLNMLSQVNVDTIKLDIRFLANLTQDGKSRHILTFIINLVKWLGLSVVAEGVETLEQAKFLKSVSCDSAQGYFFSKPLPEAEFIRLLDGGHLKNLVAPHTKQGKAKTEGTSPYETMGSSSIFREHVDAICLYEWDGKNLFLIWGNKEYYHLLWENTLNRMDILAMLHEKSREKLYRLLEQANPYQYASKTELCIHNMALWKEDKWLQAHIKPVEITSEKKLFLFSYRDISHYKKRILQLQKRTQLLQDVLDDLDEVAMVLSCNNRLQCVALNNAAVKMLGGASKEEVMAHATYRQILAVCESTSLFSHVQQGELLQGEEIIPLELPLKDGRTLRGSLHLRIADFQGEMMLYLYGKKITYEP